jgi:hypothetical protein
MRNAHAREPLSLLQPRDRAMSLMLGPMTRSALQPRIPLELRELGDRGRRLGEARFAARQLSDVDSVTPLVLGLI